MSGRLAHVVMFALIMSIPAWGLLDWPVTAAGRGDYSGKPASTLVGYGPAAVQGLWLRPPYIATLAEEVQVPSAEVAANLPELPTPPERSNSDRSSVTARLTYYTDKGIMRAGYHTFDGAVAVDKGCYPLGSIIRIIGDTRLRVALDTGRLVTGCNHIDVWAPSDEAGQKLLDTLGETVELEVIQQP